jgi:hypothetical protein
VVIKTEMRSELSYLIVRPPPPDQARGVAILDEVQSRLVDELTHALMVSGNELGAKLDDITTDRARSRAAADLVAALDNDHVMTGGG